MTLIIDVDAHAEPADGWLNAFPHLRERMPAMLPVDDPQFPSERRSADLFAWFIAADLQQGRPIGQRMSARQLLTPFIEMIYSNSGLPIPYEGANQHWALDAPQRVAWLDKEGIDVQNLISGAAYSLARAIADPVLAMDAVSAANHWMVDQVGEHIDRLKPVVTLCFDDIDRAISELTTMRGRGCRTFLVSGAPVGDIPPFHPTFDRLWAAAVDLGMMPLLHVGMGPASYHPGWANTDDPGLIKRIATAMSYQAAPMMINGMVFGGVFERHPNLTLLISEFGIDWFDFTVRSLDSRGVVAAPFLGDYSLPLSPLEYVRRNVRVSPLPSDSQSPLALLENYPDCAVFSSDYPHIEGNGSPMEHYSKVFADADPAVRERFLGGTIAEGFARMGDAL
jgi:predicted TIM-barrel fold metal-dependent hydrolase